MITQEVLLVEDLGDFYRRDGGDPGFDAVLRRFPPDGDDALADLIEADGRLRLRLDRPVTLERYLDAVADLPTRPDALDSAIDMALRGLARTGRADEPSIRRLIDSYPRLAGAIRDAAALNNALWSTRSVQRRLAGVSVRKLPCDFGPLLDGGEHRYELRELLGEGAFGQVYLAVDRQLSEEGHPAFVSIKLLAGADPSRRRQLADEATKARRINHANVARVLDRGVSADDEDFLVYEFVDGGDLARWSRRHQGDISIEKAARIVAKIARGVHAAHMAGLVHCDLKPNNIVLTADGEPKVADFGVAIRKDEQEARRGARSDAAPVGNLAFMSPEQYRMEPGALTIPTDVYALGGILYWLLTGRLPNGDTPEAIRATHASRERKRAPSVRGHRGAVDGDLEAICQRALATRPEDRYGSAGEVAADLEAWMRREPIPWTKPSVARRVGLWARRRPGVAAAWAVILVLLGAGGATLQHLRVEAALAEAELHKEEAYRRYFRARLRSFVARLKAAGADGMAHEVLPQIWVEEWLFGPDVFGYGPEIFELWEVRLETVRDMLALANVHGGDRDLRTLLWETALAFWLISDGHYGEAEPLLTQNADKWSALLAPPDPWLAYLEAMQACVTVGRLAGCDRDPGPPPAAGEDLVTLAATLEDAQTLLAGREWGTAMHHLVLVHLMMLYEPGLLDHPQRLEEIERVYLAVVE